MITAKYTVECDDCTNVPGWYSEFPTRAAAIKDAEELGWFIGVAETAFCPSCWRQRRDAQTTRKP